MSWGWKVSGILIGSSVGGPLGALLGWDWSRS